MTCVVVLPLAKYVVRTTSLNVPNRVRVTRVLVTVRALLPLCGPILTLICGDAVIVVAVVFLASIDGTAKTAEPNTNAVANNFFISFLPL